MNDNDKKYFELVQNAKFILTINSTVDVYFLQFMLMK